ncbi:unnamed protein product, partial [Rotaria socialis]
MDDYISDSDDLWITIEEHDENNENNSRQLQITKKEQWIRVLQ